MDFFNEDNLYEYYKVFQSEVVDRFNNMRSGGPRGLISMLVTYLAVSAAEQNATIVDFIGKGIQKEIMDVKHPIDETLVSIGSSQCKNVKKLIGVSYEQIEGANEPDLNSLKLLYKNRVKSHLINISDAVPYLRQARDYEPDRRLIIFVHGFTDNPFKDSFTNISASFLTNNEISLLALDGSSLIKWLYLRSTTYVQFMGRKLGEIFAVMVQHGFDPSQIHMIGHSLGAHICGFAGKTFQQLTKRKLGRISGLDPAGPCFSDVKPDLRLKETDADFVDVIHTDAGVYGLKEPVGQVDYFPNSGAKQPDCVLQTCSHSRAWILYGESVLNPHAFPALRCNDWDAFKNQQCDGDISYMGFSSQPGTRGSYFLRTGDKFPYGLGREGLRYKNEKGIVKNLGNLFG
ncbi:unnamed protein product [Leptidea sinapis]|uniref:Lipase domain-containing protein n=1 Tax=Leptidea sinapis TaxID=189913 RepID=A0A5E4QH97_9NEOP|nr:unnamed protein product [Leptidea sinapis]